VVGNELYNNGDAGLSIYATSNTMVRNNNLYDNKYGIRVLVGASDNTVR
ncbi:unnamed protein product, partial [Laminaria digitata]